MTIQQDILPRVVEICASIHDRCGVVLIGSVARGAERADSDLDLNLVFPGDERPVGRHPYVAEDNRWQLVVKDKIRDIRVDVAWETERALLARLQSDEIRDCWPFSWGRVLRDPAKIVAPCLNLAREWYQRHPEVAERYEADYTEAKRKQQLARRRPT
jgi:predicted nucleotidyltransferase